jgi:hypothetical protein
LLDAAGLWVLARFWTSRACLLASLGCGGGANEEAGLLARGSCGRGELTSQGRSERRTTRLAERCPIPRDAQYLDGQYVARLKTVERGEAISRVASHLS